MTIYEMKMLFDIHALADPLAGIPDTPLKFETLAGLHHDGLIDRVDFPSLTDKGRCFIESALATPLPKCVWKGANGVEWQA